jgi:hypothetical protein
MLRACDTYRKVNWDGLIHFGDFNFVPAFPGVFLSLQECCMRNPFVLWKEMSIGERVWGFAPVPNTRLHVKA